MSDTQFTPGPWFTGRLDGEEGERCISIGQQDLSQRPNKAHHYEDTICEVWDNPNLGESAADNADLIASAPILYEALVSTQMALEEAANILGGSGFPGVSQIMRNHALIADAALARARGEA